VKEYRATIKKLARKKLAAIARPLVAQLRAAVNVDSGSLKKSIGYRIRVKGDLVSVRVGPRVNYKKIGKRSGKEKRPARYAHLAGVPELVKKLLATNRVVIETSIKSGA
jgi:hypothetical protein